MHRSIGDLTQYKFELLFRQEIAEISLDQIGLPNTRKLAVVDKNRDLFVANVRQYKGGHGGGGGGQQQGSGKVGAMVQSLKWNSDSNMLAALQGGFDHIWSR